jgi:hypothetical protein
MSDLIKISNVEVLAPVIEVRGEIINSNFAEISEAIRNVLININLEPTTDEEFGQAKQDATSIKEVENALNKAKEEALKQAAGIQALFDDIDDLSGELAKARLKLDKAVTEKTAEIKRDIYGNALSKVIAVSSSHYDKRIFEAMKNKRTLVSLRESASREVVLINAEVNAAREIIAEFEDKHGKSIVLDTAKLELMNAEALRTELQSRVDRLAADEEKKKAQAEAEAAKREIAKMKAEAEEAAKPAPALAQESPLEDSAPSTPEAPAKNHIDKRDEIKAEWDSFSQSVLDAFAMLKISRSNLWHIKNIDRAAKFSAAVNEGWKGVNQ